MDPARAMETIESGAAYGCTETLFTFGERPGLEAGFGDHLARLGYQDILDYCEALCTKSIEAGLLPHTNAGILSFREMERLGEVNASMGLMLETTARVEAHRNSPGKDPEVRIRMIEEAGMLHIPFTTGLLLGIGESMEDREESLSVIRDLHRRFRHIQEVIIQNFCPKPGTPMAGAAAVSSDEICLTIRMAKDILPPGIAIQIPPNLADASALIECGVDDLGGISPLTVDYVNPEHAWPQIGELKGLVGEHPLRERLCIYPEFIRKGWYSSRLEPLIKRLQQNVQDRSDY